MFFNQKLSLRFRALDFFSRRLKPPAWTKTDQLSFCSAKQTFAWNIKEMTEKMSSFYCKFFPLRCSRVSQFLAEIWTIAQMSWTPDAFVICHNTFCCSRNRLENNSDHWNALFLSLRELAEWTVKKEAELETMSPVGGDEVTVRKQQVQIYVLRLWCLWS